MRYLINFTKFYSENMQLYTTEPDIILYTDRENMQANDNLRLELLKLQDTYLNQLEGDFSSHEDMLNHVPIADVAEYITKNSKWRVAYNAVIL